MTNSLKKARYWAWGDPAHRFDPQTASHFIRVLHDQLGLKKPPKKRNPVPFSSLKIPKTKLPAGFVKAWTGKGLSLKSFDRLTHATGRSYRDLVRLRNGLLKRYPDGVHFLKKEGDLPALLDASKKYGITLIPFGGGTGVVGGTECLGPPKKPVLVVDLKGLGQLLLLDEISQTATFQAGVLGPRLEEILHQKGYTLGHFPQSFEFSTLGGWVVTRSAGQNSTKYGKIEDLVVSLKVQTPAGPLVTNPVPAQATGPSLQEIFVGSEGLYGIVTQATVKISKIPQAQEFIACFFKEFVNGIHAIRGLMQKGLCPSVIRLSDGTETELFRQMKPRPAWQEIPLSFWSHWRGLGGERSFLLIAAEGTRKETQFQIQEIRRSLEESGAAVIPLSQAFSPGSEWKRHRFELPYLRDDLMDHGFFIDTLETAAEWSRLEEIHAAMDEAFEKDPLLVGCHLSHAYPDGACLYFTFFGVQEKGREIAQWEEIKTRATEVILQNGGALSHHHGIGYDHRRWMKGEKSDLGLNVLRQIKKTVDPQGLLNPEKLFDRGERI